ncbi:hypothetical protein BCR35DRAFT_305656 [Leucosporidium creatinivorum]|uniref:Glutathione synthetase n=1 Tax=Leucosporidium creatinivorum TaxID=106004 RepID=A0A1Y2EZ67_9BASI|nr:hypothetical protein BCR35DRAFT_305656 [Leucosporidium creatinivorum]
MTLNNWPPSLTTEQESHLLELATDYTLASGLVYRPPAIAPGTTPSTTSAIHAPYSLFPTPFPRHLFQQAQQLQPLYNALYAHVTTDHPFLDEVVGGAVAKVDEFQGKLYELWKQVEQEGVKQPLHLGLFRSDYLVHALPGAATADHTIKQVEFNTISSSFGSLSSKVTDLHRYLLKTNSYPTDVPELKLENLPPNPALKGLAAGLAAGHKAYGVARSAILMVTQDNERNAFDQRPLEYELLETHGIALHRIPLSQLGPLLTLDPTTSALLLTLPHAPNSPPTEISVVYYRTGYSPPDYVHPTVPSSTLWSTRLLIERSLAIKCPTLALQLSGCKKVQQVLSSPDRLASFSNKGSTPSTLSPPPTAALSQLDLDALLDSATNLYPLDDTPAGNAALELAYAHPERFVLKPQREGGGNNIYRSDIPPFLDSLAEEDKKRREGEPREGKGKGTKGEVVSELGVYGVCLFRAGGGDRVGGGEGGAEVLVNETVGQLLRTKGAESDEGGVAVGFSVIDSLLLV